MRLSLLFVLCLLVSPSYLFASSLPVDFKTHFIQINNLIENPNGDSEKSLSLIENYLLEHPDLLDSYDESLFDYFYTATDIHYKIRKSDNPYIQHAVKLSEKHNLRTKEVARLYYWHGTALSGERKLNEAEAYFFEAIEITNEDSSTDEIFVADIFGKMGLNYIWMGNMERALDILNNALNRYEKIPGLDKSKLVVVYNNIGIANNNILNYEEAIRNYEIALDIIFENEIDKKRPNQLGGTYDHLSTPLIKLKKYDEALKYLLKGLEIRKKMAKGPSNLISDSYDGIGEVYVYKKDYSEALVFHKKALSIKKVFYKGLHADIAYSYFLIGNMHRAKKEYDLAQEAYQECMSICEKVSSKKYLLYVDAYIRLAKTYRSNGELIKSLEAYEEVLFLKNTIRREQQSNNRTLSSLKSENFIITEDALEICFELYTQNKENIYLEKAFHIFEEKQAGRLLEAIHASAVEKFGNIPAEQLAIGDSLKLIVSNTEKKYFEANKKNKGSEIIEGAQQDILKAKEQWYLYSEEIKKNYPEYYDLQINPNLVNLNEVQGFQEEDEAAIEYYVGEEHLYILMISKSEVVFKQIEYTHSLTESVQKLRQFINSDDGTSKESLENFADNSHELYQLLIEPIYNPYLKGKNLCFITDGVLGYVPFDILLTDVPKEINGFRSLPYLIKENNISYAYSANLISAGREKQFANKILAFSPDFSTIEKDSIGNARFKELKYSIEEVESLGNLYSADVYKGRDASTASFIKSAPDYDIIHLATHGKADDRIGDFCFLAFSATNEEKDNYSLYVRDLYNLNLSANMVVLSACETGIGELRAGEGIISLGRGFTYAGAKSIISSLWSINDRSTNEIVTGFYAYLQKGLQKNHALRRAKLDYLETSTNPNPKNWASFTAYGDMGAIQFGKGGLNPIHKCLVGIMFSALFIFGGFIYYKRSI